MNHLINKGIRWRGLYLLAAISALMIVLVALVDSSTAMLAGEAKVNSAVSVVDWFTLFQTDRLAALGNLGLFNILTLSLGIPLYLALFGAHRQTNPALAALAAILFWIGTAIYLSSNTVFSMLALSGQYATADAAQKPLIESAGRALLAQGADLTPGTFLGFFFTQVAGLGMALVLLEGGIFGKVTPWLGVIGYALMLVFFSMAAFIPGQFNTAVMISAPGGLLLMAYQVILAIRLIKLAKEDK
jgi:hypothetical protein